MLEEIRKKLFRMKLSEEEKEKKKNEKQRNKLARIEARRNAKSARINERLKQKLIKAQNKAITKEFADEQIKLLKEEHQKILEKKEEFKKIYR